MSVRGIFTAVRTVRQRLVSRHAATAHPPATQPVPPSPPPLIAVPPPYSGRGRPPTRGAKVRPLAHTHKRRTIPATPPDRVETWREDALLLRAEVWADLVRPDAAADGPTITVLTIHDPRHREPLLLATSLSLAPRAARDCYRDRWPVEQLPLAAKQMLGAARQFVHAPETCQRLPELALLAGAVLS